MKRKPSVNTLVSALRAFFIVIALSNVLAPAAATATKGTRKPDLEWANAEAKWTDFTTKHLESMRWLDSQRVKSTGVQPNYDRKFVELRSHLISKYLPDHRLFTDYYGLFILSNKGDILSLGGGSWTVFREKAGTFFRNPKFAEFIVARGITVADPETAVEVQTLSLEITETPGRLKALRFNTKDYRIFDKRFYRSLFAGEIDWEYTAEQKENLWIVKSRYIGPPASTAGPQTFEILVDREGRIKDLYQRPLHP